MKLLLVTVLLFNSIRYSTTNVYICDSPNVTPYHFIAKCRGLDNCSHRIVTTTLEKGKEIEFDALQMGAVKVFSDFYHQKYKLCHNES